MTNHTTEHEACGEAFLTYHSGWSVPRFCHRPVGHGGFCCGKGDGRDHLDGCVDQIVIPPAEEQR